MTISGFVHGLARIMAIIGGVVLAFLTILTVVSITGRAIMTIAYANPESGLGILPLVEWIKTGALWLVEQRLQIGSWNLRVGNVPGDFELVEALTGFAVFAFLPWCQLNRAHATVDLFTAFFPGWLNRVIDLVAEILMTIVIVIIAWRLWVGMQDKIRYTETTFILQYPVWWAYAACMVGASVAVVISTYMIFVRAAELKRGAATTQGQGGHF
jgi:TRAP-type C4-dicarboxylate transport system permease small subunit